MENELNSIVHHTTKSIEVNTLIIYFQKLITIEKVQLSHSEEIITKNLEHLSVGKTALLSVEQELIHDSETINRLKDEIQELYKNLTHFQIMI